MNDEKPKLSDAPFRDRLYIFLTTPATLYLMFIGSIFGIGWTGLEGDYDD